MSILIVDDSPPVLRLLQATLDRAGHKKIQCLESGNKALEFLGIQPAQDTHPKIDCILLDIVMPGIDGIETCRLIKAHQAYRDTPVLMVTIRDEQETLKRAFEAGASDYITKPTGELELLARVKSAVKLKKEIDTRKAREQELLKLYRDLERNNILLAELTITDDVSTVGNRRYFDGCLEKEWQRSFRESAPLAVIFIEIDKFSHYSDLAGQAKADECLKLIGQVLQVSLRRAGDHLARYSGSVFAVFLPKTDQNGARSVAQNMLESVSALELKHRNDNNSELITVSMGTACVVPSGKMAISNLLIMAEEALRQAKHQGGNRCICFG
nr:diguanylate cyclase [Desulfobulbaceae bacterium]